MMRAAHFRGSLCRFLAAMVVAVSLGAALAVTAFAAGTGPVVVLVPGLGMAVPGLAPGGSCASQNSMATLCQTYVNQGYQVYIPSTSTTGSGTVLNSTTSVSNNATALSQYVDGIESANGGANVSAVGYSMGGLEIVDAIRDDGMAVNSVVTIGSPLDGSFVADSLESLANQGPLCLLSAACALTEGAANLAIYEYGTDAVASLTSSARAAENANQDPLGVPVTTFAGDGCGGTSDGVVSTGSAFGTNSNLGPTSQGSAPDVHTGGPFGALSLACGGVEPELDDQDLANAAVDATNSAGCGSDYCIPQAPHVRADVALAGDRRVAWAHGRAKASAAANTARLLTLNTADFVTVDAGATETFSGANLISSTSPYEADCTGRALLDPSAGGAPAPYTTDPGPGALTCSPDEVTFENTGSSSLTAEVLSDPVKDDVRATVGEQGGATVPIVVTAKVGIATVEITTATGHTLLSVNGHGQRIVSVMVPRTIASHHVLAATLSAQGTPFAAPLPLLPKAPAPTTLSVNRRSVRAGRKLTIAGTGWASGKVTLHVLSRGTNGSVIATLTAQATRSAGFELKWTVPSTINTKTPAEITAGQPGRAVAPATAKFRITPARKRTVVLRIDSLRVR